MVPDLSAPPSFTQRHYTLKKTHSPLYRFLYLPRILSNSMRNFLQKTPALSWIMLLVGFIFILLFAFERADSHIGHTGGLLCLFALLYKQEQESDYP